MATLRQRKLIPKKPWYLLNDEFSDTRPAGQINGTFATPGPGVRTVVDTNGKISIANGLLNFATGEAIYDGVWYQGIVRAAGRFQLTNLTLQTPAANCNTNWGWDVNQSGISQNGLVTGSGGQFYVREGGGTAVQFGTYAQGSYRTAVVLRSSGMFVFVKGGGYTNWTLVWCGTVDNTALVYPVLGAAAIAVVVTADNIRIPAALWLPSPIASDSFTRADGPLGVTDGAGHAEANGGSGKTWLHDVGAWAISTNKAVGTPTEGAEDATNGNMETGDPPTGWDPTLATLDGVADERTGGSGAQSMSIVNLGGGAGKASQALDNGAGTWVYVTGWGRRVTNASALVRVMTPAFAVTLGFASVSGTSWASILFTCRLTAAACLIVPGCSTITAADEARYDDISVKPLTLSSLFSSLQAGSVNCKARAKIAALTSGTQAGVVARLDDAATPANFIIAYMDGTNLKIDECVGGTYAALGTAAKAFTANDEIELHLSGSAYRCYHITAAGVATLIASGTTNVNPGGTLHGLFSTYASNTFGGFQCWSTGDEGQYESLNQF